jgi:uncharacterized membrane protein YgdD (TMEM256/DUF423 family)
MSSGAIGADCANCGARLAGPYCAQCGQHARPPNPTARDLVSDFAAELFNYDGRIARSVWLLFSKPGFLTREAFADRRASYVSPLRLYLIFSVLFFAAFAFAPSLFQLRYTPDGVETLDPALVAQRTAEVRAAANEAINRWLPRVMFLLMPIFAALVMLVRRRSGRNYPQHMYFAMHVHAVWFFAGTLIALANIVVVPYLSQVTKVGGVLFILGHFALAFRNAYGTGIWGTLWRAAIVALVYWILTIFALLAVWLPATLPLITKPL